MLYHHARHAADCDLGEGSVAVVRRIRDYWRQQTSADSQNKWSAKIEDNMQ